MGSFVLAASPITGHAGPMIRVAGDLVARGHRVAVLSGSRFAVAALRAGAEFEPLTGLADFDDRDQDSYIPRRGEFSGIRRAQYEIRSIFVDPIPDQARALRRAVETHRPDAVLVDGAFAGAIPLLDPRERPRGGRPPILALGVTPLSLAGPGLAPYGMGLAPAASAAERVRYRLLDFVARRIIFRPTQQAGVAAVHEAGGALVGGVMDLATRFDAFLQTGPRRLEYPRPDLPATIRFVGTLPQPPSSDPLPAWWDDLDGPRPVVHVTQGTIDNADPSRLILPTLEALASRDVLVVATGGGRDVAGWGPLPANARAARYLPYAELLPRTDLLVTNGGYGAVQSAVAHGIPVIVAGDTEEKPEVAARVAWSGAGLDLKTGRPSANDVGRAVDAVLADPSFRAHARRMSDDAAAQRPFDAIEQGLLSTRPR